MHSMGLDNPLAWRSQDATETPLDVGVSTPKRDRRIMAAATPGSEKFDGVPTCVRNAVRFAVLLFPRARKRGGSLGAF
jgi:hypothetical protein